MKKFLSLILLSSVAFTSTIAMATPNKYKKTAYSTLNKEERLVVIDIREKLQNLNKDLSPQAREIIRQKKNGASEKNMDKVALKEYKNYMKERAKLVNGLPKKVQHLYTKM